MGYVSLAITAFIVLLRLIYRKLKKKIILKNKTTDNVIPFLSVAERNYFSSFFFIAIFQSKVVLKIYELALILANLKSKIL